MIVLRDYQQECIDKVWSDLYESQTALVAMSTGLGKTETFIELIRKAMDLKPDFKCLIVVQKINLLEQTERRFLKVFRQDQVGIYNGTLNRYEKHKSITIATIQSISNEKIEGLNLIILDECHNVDQEEGRYKVFIDNHPTSKIIGFTATPFRSSGYIYGKDKLFKEISFIKDLIFGIDSGFLVSPSMKRVDHQFDVSKLKIKMGEFDQKDVEKLTGDKEKIKQQVDDALVRLVDRKKVVWACASIKHCESVCEEINQHELAVPLHSKLSDEIRDSNIRVFEHGEVRHLVFVSIVSEGYDHPPIDSLVIMRPIRSPVLYVQTVGRALRLYEGKTDALILDYGKVVETLGPLNKPLVSDGSRKKQKPIGMKFCPNCLEYVESSVIVCPVCEHVLYKPQERQATKSLTVRTFEGDILVRNFKKTMTIGAVYLYKFKSKNGNDCLRIQYISDDLMHKTINEYFVWGNEWAYKKAAKRLLELGVEFKYDLESQSMQRVTKKPILIEYEIDGKYEKITRLIFE